MRKLVSSSAAAAAAAAFDATTTADFGVDAVNFFANFIFFFFF